MSIVILDMRSLVDCDAGHNRFSCLRPVIRETNA